MIHFHTEEISFTLKNKTHLKKWISTAIEQNERKIGEISFVFCSDRYLLSINQKYLKHDTYTDIITFDYSKSSTGLPISGDIFISLERVKENAKKFSKKTDEELHRVMIHGILHLLGFKDKTAEQKKEMREAEENCLEILRIFTHSS